VAVTKDAKVQIRLLAVGTTDEGRPWAKLTVRRLDAPTANDDDAVVLAPGDCLEVTVQHPGPKA
jgi:hypothetical protein